MYTLNEAIARESGFPPRSAFALCCGFIYFLLVGYVVFPHFLLLADECENIPPRHCHTHSVRVLYISTDAITRGFIICNLIFYCLSSFDGFQWRASKHSDNVLLRASQQQLKSSDSMLKAHSLMCAYDRKNETFLIAIDAPEMKGRRRRRRSARKK